MKIRRFMSMLFTTVMVLSMFAGITFPATAAEAAVTVTDWSGLQNAMNRASAGQTIRLGADIACTKNGGDRIRVDGKTVTLDLNGHTLDRNRDKQDDDGHVIEVLGRSVLTIIDSSDTGKGGKGVIKGGYAERGGGVNIAKDATLILKGGAIRDNKAKWGGGIYVHGTLKLQGGTVAKNHANNSGGGIHIGEDGKVQDCTGGTVTENTADDCGGIYNSGSKSVTIKGVTISRNTSEQGGAGFNNNKDGKATLINCVITGNMADGNGGGFFNQEDCELTLDGCTVSNNSAKGVDGGGVYTKGTLTVKGASKFENNYSFNSGGAIRVKDGTTTIEGGSFTGNEAGDSGGAIYVNDSTLKLYGGSMTGNSAQLEGGGVLVGKDGAIKVHGAPVVRDNTAVRAGNDIYLRNGKRLDLDAKLTSGAMLVVDAEKRDESVTKNFSKQHSGEDPAKYFAAEDGWAILNSGGEGIIHQSTWPLLQALIDAAQDGGTIVLDRDYKAIAADTALNIPDFKHLTIDLNGHTVDRGLTKAVKDGAVIMNSGLLTIKDSKGGGVITGGWSTGDGGGIWNYRSLTLLSGTITGNHAKNGGGVYTSGGLYMSGGVISDNTATVEGGGVFVDGENLVAGNAAISGGAITGNTAGQNGGAMRVANRGEAVVSGGTMTGNVAVSGNGGAIDISGAKSMGLHGGTITGNKAAREGGGVLFSPGTELNASGSPVVTDNTASIGANLMMRAGSLIRVSDRFTRNAKLDLLAQDPSKKLTFLLSRKGGGNLAPFTYNEGKSVAPRLKDGELFVDLRVKADVWVSDWSGLQTAIDYAQYDQVIGLNQSIYANGKGRIKVDGGKRIILELNGFSLDRARTSSDGDGHVIEVTGNSKLTIRDSIGTGVITGGYATRGGGINIASGSTLILEGGNVRENKAEWGGGIYVHGTLVLKGGTISGNDASGSGGGIHVGEEGTVRDCEGGTVTGNTSDDCGGIYNSGSKNVTLKNVTIVNNTSESGGGVNNNKGGTMTLTNCEISGNHAEGNGGGVWNQEDSTLTLVNCTIENNIADGQGGGVFTKGDVTVTGGEIKGNIAAGNGGGIRLWDGKTTINSGAITGNKAKDGHGGGIYVGGATLNLYGGEITGNTASNEGGGIRIEQVGDGVVNVHGAPVVKDNKAEMGNGIFIREEKVLTVDGRLAEGAEIHVTPEDLNETFTTGFNANNKNEDPQAYFRSDVADHTVVARGGEARVIGSEWSNLQRQIDAAAEGATITLDRNWNSVEADLPLIVPEGKTLTIDLNGYMLDRGLSERMTGGSVIENNGTLTILDSKGTGAITGGNTDGNGGGIRNNGTLTIESGIIEGNKARSLGGGVYNSAKGSLTVLGGTIRNNGSDQGGGVFTEGALEIKAGEIKANTATGDGGGALAILKGTATITGGKMTGNASSQHQGGAIYMRGGTVNLYGGEITQNRAAMDGGGILYNSSGVLNVQGGPVVKDNIAARGGNIMLRPKSVIHVTGQLAAAAQLDVMAQNTENVLTDGLAQNGSLDNFTYNGNAGVKPGLKDGELFVDLTVDADAWATDWKGLQDAIDKAKSGQVIALGNNISAVGEGRIKVDGKTVTLDLNGYTMDRGRVKSDDDGHVIEVVGKSTLTIRDSKGTGVIQGGWATRGGGINIASGSTCILEGGHIRGNRGKWGGGVYVHGTFKMTGGIISTNEATSSGGGIHIGKEGTVDMTGGTIFANTADDCGGIFNSGSKNVTLKNVRIIENRTTEEGGGGFNNNDGGSATLRDCEIRGNVAAGNGGGLWNQEDSSLTLNNCTVTGNSAGGHGGGIFTKGKLTLAGGSITGNTASANGGGINVANEKSVAVNVSGSLVVRDNDAGKGANVYLSADKTMTVAGAMKDGASVGAALSQEYGTIARGFASKNPNEEPGRYFFSDDSYELALEGSDAVIMVPEFDLDGSDDFIPSGSRIVSYENVNSRNWLSGVSGERRLNEINIPGTHDSSMNKLKWHRMSSITTIGGYAKNARTQTLYIDEQLDAGYRWLDLRVNNKYEKSFMGFTKEVDDGKNLYMCHGKAWAHPLGIFDLEVGTIWAADRDGRYLSLNKVLEWVKAFLRKHPTEFIVLDITPENPHESTYPTIKSRARKILRMLSQEINPSTGKSYVYMPTGFNRDYSMPKLKDVRGQVLLYSNEVFGGLSTAGYTRYTHSSDNRDDPYTRSRAINAFFTKYGNLAMPTDALTHFDFFYRVYTNATWEKGQSMGIPKQTPLENAAIVIPSVFGDGGYYDQQGLYRGWATLDGATAREAAMMWRSNFYDMDYVTVTVNSGLSASDLASGDYTANDDAASGAEGESAFENGKQTYRLLKGTEITLPECIYDYDPEVTGRTFQSWNATGETVNETHYPGETFVVMEDTTFTGQWLAEGEISVDVVWQDMDDMDGLRADSLDLQVWPDDDPEHAYTQTVTAADGWRAVLAGDVQKIVPVWERIDAKTENGADTPEGYRYEVSVASAAKSDEASEEGAEEAPEVELGEGGLIVTLVHTPQATIAAAGTIAWDDYEDRDGLRPESVTLHLMKGEEELDSRSVTAEGGWQFDFGELTGYEDGQAVAYRLTEDAISGYNSVAVQLSAPAKAAESEGSAEAGEPAEAKSWTVTNIHIPKVVNLSGSILWEDADDAAGARPGSVNVRLLANGEEISALTVTPEGANTTLLDVPMNEEETGASEGDPDEGIIEEEVNDEEEAPEEAEAEEDEDAYEFYGGDDEEEADAGSGEAADGAEADGTTNVWSFDFYGVPVYGNGREIEYRIVQDAVTGYETTVETGNGTWFTNTALPEMVTLSFDGNGGEGEMAGVEVDPRSGYELPACGFTAPEGMEFAGWTLTEEAPAAEQSEAEGEDGEATEIEAEAEPEAEAEAEAETQIGTESETDEPTLYSVGEVISLYGNATLTAQWREIAVPAVITFDGNGGEGEMEAAQPDAYGEYTLPESGFTAPEGMAFAGWKVAMEAPAAEESAEDTEESAETPAEANAAEDDTADEEVASEGERIYAAGDKITVTADATVIAQWQEIAEPVVYAVTFDGNGGEGEMAAATAGEDGSFTLPENGFTAPEGTGFAGWLIETEAAQAEAAEPEGEAEAEADAEAEAETGAVRLLSAGDVIVVSGDTTVIAQWGSTEVPEEAEAPIVITFDGNGGEGEMAAAEPEEDGSYVLPENGFTAPEGMAFAGWLVGEETCQAGEVIDVTEAVTAVAQWKPTEAPEEVEAPIVITFDANGGEGEMEAAEPDEEGKYELPECGFTAPEGMGFAGWLVGEETCQAGEVIDVTEAVTAVAQWQEPAPEENAEAEGGEDDEAAPEGEEDTEEAEPEGAPTKEQTETAQTYMILFDENGGTGDMPIEEVAGGSAYTLPENAYTAPEGTVFAGWQTGDGIHMPGETVTVSEDTLLKAVWAPIEAETPEATEPEQTETEPEQAETEPVEPEAPEATEPEQAETEPEQAEAEATEPEQAETEPVEPEAPEASEPEQAETESEQTEAEAPEATEPEQAEAEPEQTEAEASEPEQAETEPEAAPAAEAPERTISFDGGGGTGDMGSESAADGSEYTLPACGFEIEGAVFDCWEISGNNVSAPYTAKAGETIVVDGDLTATAMWTIDESAGGPEATDAEADEAQAPEAEGAPEAEEAPDEADDGLNVEYEAVPEEDTTGKVEEEAGEADEDAAIEATTEEAPSEVGTIFGGAGTAAIVAAIALILAAIGITIARKKKK